MNTFKDLKVGDKFILDCDQHDGHTIYLKVSDKEATSDNAHSFKGHYKPKWRIIPDYTVRIIIEL